MAIPMFPIAQTVVSGVSSLLGQYLQGKSDRAYYQALQSNYNTNADLNDIQTARQSAYINESAASQVHQMRKQGQVLEGSQKAAMAAQGMDLSSGSAQAVLSSSERAQREDEDLVRYQAELAAFENNKQGALSSANLRSQARLASISAKQSAVSSRLGMAGTILTSALGVGGQVFDYLQQNKTQAAGLKANYGYTR